MDYDGIPELAVKYGTCEADYRIALFTYNSNGLKELADNMPGSHTGFAYDYVANQLVLAQGHMGYGDMSWYDIDENGELRFLISTGRFDFNYSSYDSYMEKYNVAWLDGASYSLFYGSQKTWVLSYPNGEYEYVEYEGLDFSFLENNIL